jgi:hypothetical protein
MMFKRLAMPGKKDSPTHEVTLNIFKTGTPEEYIKTLIVLDQVCIGQNLKDAEEKYTMAHRVFEEAALTAFNNAAKKSVPWLMNQL